MPPAPLGFLTTAQACERLGHLDRSTLSRWVQIGKITPAHKFTGLRGAFLFDPAEVDRVRNELQDEASSA